MQVQDSVFFVTGAASGLGEATARMLSASGAAVVIADVNDAAGMRLASELGGRTRFARVDVTDELSVRRGLDIGSDLGTLRGVVNAAGIVLAEKVLGRNGPHALDAFARIVQVNLAGSFNVIRLAARSMSGSAPTASASAAHYHQHCFRVCIRWADRNSAAYSASKGGIVGMTLPIARELARYGIRVMTIAPVFSTRSDASLPQAARESLAAQCFPRASGNRPNTPRS